MKYYKQLFEKLDIDHKGYLDKQSLNQHFKNSQYCDLLLSQCDKSKDGKIDIQEFTDFCFKKELELESLFYLISDNQQKIRFSQLRDSFNQAGIKINDTEIREFINTVGDNDGVDYNSWRDFLLLLPHKPTLESVYEYYQTDFNSDAYIDVSQDYIMRLKYLLAGGIAGCVSRTYRLKVLLQTETQTHRHYNHWVSIRKGIFKIYNDGGILSFFRGNGLNVLKIVPESALKFYVFEYSKQFIADHYNTDKESLGMIPRLFAGGMGGLVSQFAIYPIETIKTRTMAQIVSRKVSIGEPIRPHIEDSLLQTVKNLYKENGIRAFYRGCVPALIGINLAVFETLKNAYLAFKNDNQPMPIPITLGCGMVSGTCGAVLILQAQGTPSHPTYYNSAFDVVHKTYKREGLVGFYRGLAPTLLKVLPAVSISYVVYESSKQYMNLS
ncbi:hypothetical protein HK103_004929 [Boothiomyces macroporosus]|uniref:EF-hand domain-containing protein n=1 Tax=Boothiomyces macroporosus TaxID=261099 RepID=A0AAD5Y851_9FUNG|nr:hypothetical protein HK103_004929 [Boothiomyces macroporosus]